MAKGMTVDEVKKEKIKLERNITKLLQDFEKVTGVKADYFNISRKRESDYPPPTCVEDEKGPIIDTEVQLRFDI